MPTHRSTGAGAPPTEPQGRGAGSRRRSTLHNLGSVRILVRSLVLAVLIGGTLGLLWHPLGWIAWPLFFIFWLSSALSPTTVTRCQYCRSRVKLGATVCRRCGRRVA